jgi:deoxyribonuclease V
MTDLLDGEDRGAEDALALQQRLASQVLLRDAFSSPISTVAGFVLEAGGAHARASVALLDSRDFSVLEAHVMAAPEASAAGAPLHDVPVLLAVLHALTTAPDLALVDGWGLAHPRRFGVASHFGVASGLPCIGVAEDVPPGTASPLHQVRGAYTPLRDHGKQVGWLLRTQADAAALVVSPGHRVAMASTADLVMRLVAQDRWPEPLRLARQLLSRTA